jgi:hypothetical protein
MPAAVARQRDILAAMLHVVEREPALRWFELGCSLGRDSGDELSDIDCAVGVADDVWTDARDLGRRLAAAGGPIADSMRQVLPSPRGEPVWHEVTLYDDGTQLSLVLMPASSRRGLPPHSVALYDADGRLAMPDRPAAADANADTLREWAALGWIALGDVAKYLDRGSLWEAYQRLNAARDEALKLWAAGHHVEFPVYGLTAILDTPGLTVPPGMVATIATLDPADLRRAAIACADALSDAIDGVTLRLTEAGLGPPTGLENWVRRRLVHASAAPSACQPADTAAS